MVEPWSQEWVGALDEAARRSPELAEASRGRRVVISQEVLDGDAVHGWHVVLDHGEVRVRPGGAPDADVRFRQTRSVADAVAAGEMSARTAFVLGQIQVGGDTSLLLELGPALAGLTGGLAPVGTDED